MLYVSQFVPSPRKNTKASTKKNVPHFIIDTLQKKKSTPHCAVNDQRNKKFYYLFPVLFSKHSLNSPTFHYQ
jgi:hypothetical protein